MYIGIAWHGTRDSSVLTDAFLIIFKRQILVRWLDLFIEVVGNKKQQNVAQG